MKTTVLKLLFVTIIVFFVGILRTEAQETVTKVYEEVDKMPEYPGGKTMLLQDLTSSIEYPEIDNYDGTDGKVYVSFVVNKEGKIKDVRIARGIGPEFDKEALRVISELEKTWNPGIEDDKKVDVSVTVLFKFDKEGTVVPEILTPLK